MEPLTIEDFRKGGPMITEKMDEVVRLEADNKRLREKNAELGERITSLIESAEYLLHLWDNPESWKQNIISNAMHLLRGSVSRAKQ